MLTQDAFAQPPTAPPPPPGVAADDRYGKDVIVEPSAFDDKTFNVLNLPNDISALDPFNIEDTFINPFSGVLRVPQSAWADWATAFSKVSNDLINACELPTDDPMRTKRILQAAKWYSALPQLILREPSRSPDADVKIVATSSIPYGQLR